MLYEAYQAQDDLAAPVRAVSTATALALRSLPHQSYDVPSVRRARATSEVVATWGLSHRRPPFGIATATVAGERVGVREETVRTTPFATLLHFAKDMDAVQPRVLLVAPLAGHFSTLLRATVRTLLADHEVFITDWHNARDVSAAHGRFGLDEYVDHLIGFLDAIGAGAHVIAVCQPCVPTLAATAVMSEGRHPAEPRSVTLIAGPVDTRVNPTDVNRLATSHPLAWFEHNLIATVPLRFEGALRRVYPGFVQVAAFMSLDPGRHAERFQELYDDLVNGNEARATATKQFYDEYFAVLDLPAEFYLETIDAIFQRHALALGCFEWRGRRIDPRALTRTALLTVEGENDQICAVGQTAAAHDLCLRVRPFRRRQHLQAGVGHFGVFSGRRWEREVYPVVRNFILSSD
jgi:polyhydroxyalkanoate depolymerase